MNKLVSPFVLDANRRVTGSLKTETGPAIKQAHEALMRSKQGGAILKTAGLFVINPSQPQDIFCRDAFTAGAGIAFEAFLDSSVPFPAQERILDQVEIISPPVHLLGQTADETRVKFANYSRDGHRRHREMSDATKSMMGYYEDELEAPELATVAFAGMGFTIIELERAWERIEAPGIDRAVREATSEFDWDSLLPKSD